MAEYRSEQMRTLRKSFVFVLLLLYTVFILGPFVWVGLISLRTTEEFYRNPYGLPVPAHFEKFVIAWTEYSYGRYFLNSVFVVGTAVIFTVIVGSMAAYCFAKFRFRFSETLFYTIFLSIMFPPQIRLISLYQILSQYRLLDTRTGLILVYVSTQLTLTIFLLRDFFETIPKDLLDAARIDGCTEWGTFWKIAFPVVKPGLSAVAILNFVFLWTEFLFAVTFISSESKRTLPLGVIRFLGERYEDIGMVATGVMIAVIPILILYIVLSERFIQSMVIGAIKG
jgi:ABC-type glycerol-3-phosphate transport system permease component